VDYFSVDPSSFSKICHAKSTRHKMAYKADNIVAPLGCGDAVAATAARRKG
jgi:hypothetical protein